MSPRSTPWAPTRRSLSNATAAPDDIRLLVHEAASGGRRATGRLISLLERGGEDARRVARATFPRTGRAYTVGITGPMGVGKSTLVDRLISLIRSQGSQVGVIAVDPSSARSGGAVLGDRVRMQQHAADPAVFIRSMATRGRAGGLAAASREAVRVLDATGRPWVLVETVGAGQAEVDVASVVDTTVVMLAPGWGDEVQADKAGMLEVADVYVVNKVDLPNASDSWRSLEAMLETNSGRGWRPPVLAMAASTGEGLDRLWDAIKRHREWQEESETLTGNRAARLTAELRAAVADLQATAGEAQPAPSGEADFDVLATAVVGRRMHPLDAAEQFVAGGARLGD